MLHELEVLEARHVADLAWDARKVRDRLLEKVPDAQLGEPVPARGEHNPSGDSCAEWRAAGEPEFVPCVRRSRRCRVTSGRSYGWWRRSAAATSRFLGGMRPSPRASALRDDDIAAGMVAEPDLHEHLRKGLYELGRELRVSA